MTGLSRPVWVTTALALTASALTGQSCHTPASRPGPGAGGAYGDAGPSTTSATQTVGEGGSAACPPSSRPDDVPASWTELADWSCDCRFYVPDDGDHMPAPIGWGACPDLGDGVVCESMVVEWTDSPPTLAVDPEFGHDNDGRDLLSFVRVTRIFTIFLLWLRSTAPSAQQYYGRFTGGPRVNWAVGWRQHRSARACVSTLRPDWTRSGRSRATKAFLAGPLTI